MSQNLHECRFRLCEEVRRSSRADEQGDQSAKRLGNRTVAQCIAAPPDIARTYVLILSHTGIAEAVAGFVADVGMHEPSP
jgi:hypothetical protein